MKHKVSELDGALLDAAVAQADGLPFIIDSTNAEQWVMAARPGYSGADDLGRRRADRKPFAPSTDWEDGGPLIEREKITICGPDVMNSGLWEAFIDPIISAYDDGRVSNSLHADITGTFEAGGATPLIASMRAYVASKLGSEIDLP